MKTRILRHLVVMLGIGLWMNGAQAQSYCSDFQGNLSPSSTAQTLASTGGYYTFSATAGCTYTFTHCSNGGSYTGDTYMRITTTSNSLITSNDDWCGLGSQITWTPFSSGTYRLHLGECCGSSVVFCSGGPSRTLAYYSTNCCNNVAVPVVSTPDPECGPYRFTLTANNPTNTVHWFETASTSNQIGIGNSYTTPPVTSSRYYYAAEYNAQADCYSGLVPVYCEIIPGPVVLLSAPYTNFCVNQNEDIELSLSPQGGLLSGSGITGSTFNPTATQIGVHRIKYEYTDPNTGCVGKDSINLIVESPAVDPQVSVCNGGSAELYASVLNPVWTLSPYGNQAVDTGNPITVGPINQNTNYYYGELIDGSTFIVNSLSTSGSVDEHDFYSGDDRGGIAVTQNYVYYVGDQNTVRASAVDLTGMVSLPQRDGIFSDLSDGQLYTFADASGALDGTYFTTTVDRIIPMDINLNVLSANTIMLSSPITINNNFGACFIAAGRSEVMLYNSDGSEFYLIDISTGDVTLVNSGNLPFYISESWASWGVLNKEDGDYKIMYRGFGDDIFHLNVSTLQTELLRSFNDISDMASLTYSPFTSRMYFHYEGSGEFGGFTETIGYIDANHSISEGSITQGCRTRVPVVISPYIELGNDTFICQNVSIALSAQAGSGATYSWSTGAFGSGILVTEPGTYSVTVTGEDGCSSSDTITIEDGNCVGIKENGAGQSVSVYPNPATDNITISVNGAEMNEVVIFDVTGKMVMKNQAINADQYNVSLSEMPSGLYMLRVSTADRTEHIQIVKE